MSPSNPLSRLSTRVHASGIRQLEQLAKARPELISLGPGQPDATLFPALQIAGALHTVFDNPDATARALQYGPSQGHPELLDLLAQYMSAQGVRCATTNILVTSGAQQAIDLIAQLFVDEGDCVRVQPETYPGALQVFRARGAQVESLEAPQACTPGRSAKLIYAMSDFQNPGGTVLSAQGRAQLLAQAREQGAFVVEDSPYREIRFSPQAREGECEPVPTLLAMDCGEATPDAGRTLFVGSFSKIIAPGLRIGWIAGPADVISRLTLLRQASDLQPGSLSQTIIVGLLKRGMVAHLARVRQCYQARRDALLAALQRHMRTYASWNVPQGGFFVWVKLSVPIDTHTLLNTAIAHGVAYVPGAEFHHDGRASSDLRLSFSSVDPGAMDEAMRRLAAAIAEVLGSAGQEGTGEV